MAFNTIEYLKEGKVDFVYSLTIYDRESLIKYIRNNEGRNTIINGFLPLLLDSYYRFCFEIIYDNEDYKNEALYLLNKYYSFDGLDNEKIINILNNTSWGKRYIIDHIDEIYKDEDLLLEIFNYIFNDINNNYDFIKMFYLNDNLHIRYLFMKYIVNNYPELINVIYDDFTKYLTSVTYKENEQLTFLPTLMDMKDICKLAIAVFNSTLDKKIWEQLKEYILENYPSNNLADELLSYEEVPLSGSAYTLRHNPLKIEEFVKDAERLFNTSNSRKLYIYHNYAHLMTEEMRKKYASIEEMFKKDGQKSYVTSELETIYRAGLGSKLELYVEKYLDLSHSKDMGYIASGATGACYRIGDYVIKLFRTKWSYEDVICPNLYLIIKNEEEDYVRDKNGIVCGGIEVQRYLTRTAKNVSSEVLVQFEKELRRLGYYSLDTFVNGTCGDNCMILDTYKDANCNNPDRLPEWFKETPLVLVDRDDIYKLSNKYPKHRHSAGY